MKLFVICGHGAGDSGACGNGYQEQERVRALGRAIKELGGDNVMLGDTNRNYYADNGISGLSIPKDYQIIELHMDSASPSARGAHVIINGGFEADQYDKALATFLTGLFAGRSNAIVARNDLANPARAAARGYGYRLIECGFISNAEDVSIFNNNIDKIAYGILGCFGLSGQGNTSGSQTPAPDPTPNKTVDQIAQEVINGAWGNNPARREALEAAGYDYNAIQARVNEMCGGNAAPAPTPSKTVDQLAQEVINGAWGNNPARREALEAAGYDYNAIQARVNEMCGGSAAPKPSGKSIDQLAQEVINGAWGNNPARREKLEAAGYDYNAIQARVNQLLG